MPDRTRYAISYGTCVVCQKLTTFRSARPGKTCPTGPCRRALRNQQAREYHRRYAEENGEAYSTRHRRVNGRNDTGYAKTCAQCDEEFMAQKSDAKFCSPECYTGSKRHRPGRHLPVLHPDPSPLTHLPAKHPAIAGTPRRGEWWKLVVSGPCAWCDETFTSVAACWESRAIYCSGRCTRNAGRARRGRFLVPPRVRLAIYERDGWICQLCDEPVDPNLGPSDIWAATLDHVECQSWGEPDHSPENLRLAHRWCNSVRGDESHYTADVLRVAS